MTIHLLPVTGHQINSAWDSPYAYGKWEELFVRCRKTGRLGKALGKKTSVYKPFEVMKALEKDPTHFKIHW